MSYRTTLLLPVFLAGCGLALAQDPPPPTYDDATIDPVDKALVDVTRTARAVAAGVADGSIDLKTRGPAIVMAFTRLSLAETRLEALAEKVKPVAPVEEITNTEAPPTEAVAEVKKEDPKAKPTASESKEADVTTPVAPAERTESTASTAKVESDKTGIASVDKFLMHVATLSADLDLTKKKLEGARSKLTGALGLAKKFKPADAEKALKERLGTGYKIALSPSVKVTPGPDAKDPGIVNDVKSAFTDLQDVQKRVVTITKSAADIAKEGTEVPKQAKAELEAMGPIKAAEALGKVSKGAKTVSKVPKDAKALSDEVTLWTKIAGG